MRLRYAPFHNPLRVVCFSNAFVFFQFRTLWPQRSTRNPFSINHFRTLSRAKEGGGMCSALIPNPEPLLPATPFQQLTAVKSNYPTRIVRPERSEGSLCLIEADTARLCVPIYFQQLTAIKFCNSSLLITMQDTRGV